MLAGKSIIFILFTAISVQAAEKPLDFWEDVYNFASSSSDKHISAASSKRNEKSEFSLEHADRHTGDFSICFQPDQTGKKVRFGFVASRFGGTWALTPASILQFWLKVQDTQAPDQWEVILVDKDGKEVRGALSGTAIGASWRDMKLQLAQLKAPDNFQWQAVKLCEFEATFGKNARILFDEIRFVANDKVLSVTDKPLSQRMAEAKASRSARIETGYKQTARKDSSPAVMAFAKMYLNEDLDNANQMLADYLKNDHGKDPWSLLNTPLYCRFYYCFSSRAGKFPGRMHPDVEKLLLETIWLRTVTKNDIFWSRQSTWWLDGSENHDLNSKASDLVSSRIFMNEPDYKDRVYPDYGFGGGYHYGHGGYYGKGVDPNTRHFGGRANLSDGKKYTAKDHYEAWLKFLKEYFRGRAQRGFFLEASSLIYSKHTLNFVDLAYQYGGDEDLHRIIGDFLTLYWADWAQNSIAGVHGGPKTRHHYSVGGFDCTGSLIAFHLGGAADAGTWQYWNVINDYELPSVVWRMALDRQGMGSFVYRARGIGEEENVWPRPLGAERSMTVDTDARFLKYTYVTPDYTLGTQMDHPAAAHSHLSIGGRWHGMTFAEAADSRIVPVAIPEHPDTHGVIAPFGLEVEFRTAQYENTLIVQQSRSYLVINPDWFPGPGTGSDLGKRYEEKIGVYVGNNWDQRLEKDGWIFLRKGNAYAAVRPILYDKADEDAKKDPNESTQKRFSHAEDIPTLKLRYNCYTWNDKKDILLLTDQFSPVIIQAGRRADYPTIEQFMADVLDNSLALYKTVTASSNILVYTGCGKNAPEIVFNAGTTEIPTVGGKYIDYSYPMTFESPYLKSVYKSGKITINYDGDKLDLNFTRAK